MDKDSLWNLFMVSGSVDAYLLYRDGGLPQDNLEVSGDAADNRRIGDSKHKYR